MAHQIEKIYDEGNHSWAVVCTCGWKEKAISQNSAKLRFVTHARKPQ